MFVWRPLIYAAVAQVADKTQYRKPSEYACPLPLTGCVRGRTVPSSHEVFIFYLYVTDIIHLSMSPNRSVLSFNTMVGTLVPRDPTGVCWKVYQRTPTLLGPVTGRYGSSVLTQWLVRWYLETQRVGDCATDSVLCWHSPATDSCH